MKKITTLILTSTLLITAFNSNDVQAATKVKQNIKYTDKRVMKSIKKGAYDFNGFKLNNKKSVYINKSKYDVYGIDDCCMIHVSSENEYDTAYADYINGQNSKITRIVDYYTGKTLTPSDIKKIYGTPDYRYFEKSGSNTSYVYIYPKVTFIFNKWNNEKTKLYSAIQTSFNKTYQKKWVKMAKDKPDSNDFILPIDESTWNSY